MKVKVCGMRDAKNITEVAALSPDYLGFIFYKPSPRCCNDIDPEVIESLPNGIEPVMVSVNMAEEEVKSVAKQYGFRTVQLHGNESPEMCQNLRNSGMTVIKAMGMSSEESLKALHKYGGAVDFFLLDTKTPSKGGSGKKFDWSILEVYNLDEPFLLSGGIGPDDAEAILSITHPKFIGIDLNSRFEISPGLKNASLLKLFLNKIHNYE